MLLKIKDVEFEVRAPKHGELDLRALRRLLQVAFDHSQLAIEAADSGAPGMARTIAKHQAVVADAFSCIVDDLDKYFSAAWEQKSAGPLEFVAALNDGSVELIKLCSQILEKAGAGDSNVPG